MVVLRMVTMAWLDLERDGLIASTSVSTCNSSPARTGRGHSISPPTPITPVAIGMPPAREHAHGERGGVPSARRESAEQGRFGRGLVEMKRLRIIRSGEVLDLRRGDRKWPRGEALSDMKILKVEPTGPSSTPKRPECCRQEPDLLGV